MARRPVEATAFDAEVEQIKRLLDHFLEHLESHTLRERVKSLVPAVLRLRDLGSSLIPRQTAASARDRILHYLNMYPKLAIDGDELFVVSGIGEWARRVRELRVQYGWWIYSGVTVQEILEEDPAQIQAITDELGIEIRNIGVTQYILMRTYQDREAALRWNQLNAIRKSRVSTKEKLLEYFRANVGRIVSGEELRYLAGDTREWTRRTRELRTEDGWPIFSKMQGRPEIPVGAYVLDEDKQAPAHDRRISDAIRVEVLVRDAHSCTHCGWTRSQLAQGDPRKFLELHHVVEHSKGGENSSENLLTLCNVHHDQVHAGALIWDDGRRGYVKSSDA